MEGSKEKQKVCKKLLKVITAHTLSELVTKINNHNLQEEVEPILREDILDLRKEDNIFLLSFFTT